MKRILYLHSALCASAAFSAVLGAATAWWGLHYAYAQRGYFAVGGEWALILAAVLLPFACNPGLWRSR